MSEQLNQRFRGYFPVVIDIETAGFNHLTDAILEIAACTLAMDSRGLLFVDKTVHFHIEPFLGANLEPEALKFTGIDPFNPLRFAVNEAIAFDSMFKTIATAQKEAKCSRSIIVAHNANFDYKFMQQAILRNELKRSPFHPFTTIDTASLAALMVGHTVLLKACEKMLIEFDNEKAHSALYDAQKTAELFCKMVNKYKILGGWPLNEASSKK